MKKRTAMPFYGKNEQITEAHASRLMQAGHRDDANSIFEELRERLAAKREAWEARATPMRDFNAVIKMIGRSGTTRKGWYAPREGFRQRKPQFFGSRAP